jgi:hypothetical protein
VTSDASVLVGRITAQGTSNAGDRLALWLQGTQAIAAVATTLGVLIALYVAVVREPRKVAEQRRRHKAQTDALRRAAGKRVAAQARKVVPSCIRAPMFGDSWWTVRIDNTSNAVAYTTTKPVINGDAPISARRNARARNWYSRRRPRARFLANVNCNVL